MSAIEELSEVSLVLCSASEEVATKRALQRGIDAPDREFYHGDHRVVHFKTTGELLPPAPYEPPNFDVPTIHVSTDEEYVPSIDEIVGRLRAGPKVG